MISERMLLMHFVVWLMPLARISRFLYHQYTNFFGNITCGYFFPLIFSYFSLNVLFLRLKCSKSDIFQQHKEFEEIEGRLQRREPLILGTTATQRLNQRLPVEVISDPLHDVEKDPYEAGYDAHKLKGHQVCSCHELRRFYPSIIAFGHSGVYPLSLLPLALKWKFKLI